MKLNINSEIASTFSLAAQQNAYPLLNRVSISASDELKEELAKPNSNIRVCLTSEPKFVETREGEFQRFFPLVIQHMNNNSTVLMECPENFEGLFPQREVDGKIFRVVDDWCEGYLKGVDMDHDGWMKAPKKIIEEHLSVMHVFGSGEHDDRLDQLSADGIRTLQDKVEKGAIAMHAYFLQLRSCAPPSPVFNKPAPISVSPSVGRNAPCPCGSGKKYKKCCLQ